MRDSGLPCAIFSGVLTVSAIAVTAQIPSAANLLSSTGLKAGLVVVAGLDGGDLEAQISAGGNILVHGLETSPQQRDLARNKANDAGLNGIAVHEWLTSFKNLPYNDNFVNLVVADLDALSEKGLTEYEIERVVTPGGYSYVKKSGAWSLKSKPVSPNLDGWPHYWHDVTCTGASNDRVCGIPNVLKWINGNSGKQGGAAKGAVSPTEHNSESGFRADNGRVAYNIDDGSTIEPGETKRSRRHMVMRDAYNGVPYWRYIGESGQKTGYGRMSTILLKDRFYTVLGANSPVVEFDAVTGAQLRKLTAGFTVPGSIKSYTEYLQCLIHNGKMVQVRDNTVLLLDLASGAVAGKYAETGGNLFFPVIAPDQNALFLTVYTGQMTGWRYPAVGGVKGFIKLGLDDLAVKWRAGYTGNVTQIAYRDGRLVGFNSGRGDAIANDESDGRCSQPCGAFSVDAASGKVLWVKHGRCATGTGGKVNVYNEDFPGTGKNMVVWKKTLWVDEVPLDWNTGATVSRLYKKEPYNTRCVGSRAAADWYALGFTEYYNGASVDAGGPVSAFSHYAARSNCSQPALPAYGQWYFTPAWCICILNKIEGFLALATQASHLPVVPDNERLQNGEAYLSTAAATAPVKTSYGRHNEAIRHDVRRTNNDFADDSITPPSSDGGRVFTAVSREHRIEARVGGGVAWRFTAGGRVSTAPLVKDGKVYAACHDGWVYCLEASGGKLLWRFMAAPSEKKVVAYGQLESAWPVYNVVAFNDQIAFCAGRSAELDNGMVVYSVNAATGKMSWKVPVRLYNALIKPANTSRSRENGLIAYSGGKIVINDIQIDPANPEGYVVENKTAVVGSRQGRKPLPWFSTPDFGPPVAAGRGGIVTVAAPSAGPQEIVLLDHQGRTLCRAAGMGPNVYHFSVPASRRLVARVRAVSREDFVEVLNLPRN